VSVASAKAAGVRVVLALASASLLGASAEQPYLVKDLVVGSSSTASEPAGFVGLGDRVVFTAETRNEGRELWSTDGTAEGTELIRDLHPGKTGTSFGSLHAAGDRLYFIADGRLWTSDGSFAGSLRLDTDEAVVDVAVFQEKVYFVTQHALWTTDGTQAGTLPIFDAWPISTPS
jgi:ELWxxDGT repeat protein